MGASDRPRKRKMTNRYFARSPENFCGFLLEFAWEFCIEKGWGFLVNFFWSPFPTKRSTKTPQKIGENSERNSGRNPGRNFEKFGKLSFCNFSDLTNRESPRRNRENPGNIRKVPGKDKKGKNSSIASEHGQPLAAHFAVPRGTNVMRMNANRAI